MEFAEKRPTQHHNRLPPQPDTQTLLSMEPGTDNSFPVYWFCFLLTAVFGKKLLLFMSLKHASELLQLLFLVS